VDNGELEQETERLKVVSQARGVRAGTDITRIAPEEPEVSIGDQFQHHPLHDINWKPTENRVKSVIAYRAQWPFFGKVVTDGHFPPGDCARGTDEGRDLQAL